MQEQKHLQNCMQYRPLFAFYEQMQTMQNVLKPDMEFLSDTYLGRYPEHILHGLELPENIYHFLNQVGLPNLFFDWRSPDEEMEAKNLMWDFGVMFSLRCMRIEKIQKCAFLMIGECYSMSRYGVSTNNELRTYWKMEDCSYIAVELKTGNVWSWYRSFDDDFLRYINSSLEQYLLSMAYWKAFYTTFSQKVKQFKAQNPDKTELNYIFKHEKMLYAPFLEQIKALDPQALRKRNSYWKFMCDLSLY